METEGGERSREERRREAPEEKRRWVILLVTLLAEVIEVMKETQCFICIAIERLDHISDA